MEKMEDIIAMEANIAGTKKYGVHTVQTSNTPDFNVKFKDPLVSPDVVNLGLQDAQDQGSAGSCERNSFDRSRPSSNLTNIRSPNVTNVVSSNLTSSNGGLSNGLRRSSHDDGSPQIIDMSEIQTIIRRSFSESISPRSRERQEAEEEEKRESAGGSQDEQPTHSGSEDRQLIGQTTSSLHPSASSSSEAIGWCPTSSCDSSSGILLPPRKERPRYGSYGKGELARRERKLSIETGDNVERVRRSRKTPRSRRSSMSKDMSHSMSHGMGNSKDRASSIDDIVKDDILKEDDIILNQEEEEEQTLVPQYNSMIIECKDFISASKTDSAKSSGNGISSGKTDGVNSTSSKFDNSTYLLSKQCLLSKESKEYLMNRDSIAPVGSDSYSFGRGGIGSTMIPSKESTGSSTQTGISRSSSSSEIPDGKEQTEKVGSRSQKQNPNANKNSTSDTNEDSTPNSTPSLDTSCSSSGLRLKSVTSITPKKAGTSDSDAGAIYKRDIASKKSIRRSLKPGAATPTSAEDVDRMLDTVLNDTFQGPIPFQSSSPANTINLNTFTAASKFVKVTEKLTEGEVDESTENEVTKDKGDENAKGSKGSKEQGSKESGTNKATEDEVGRKDEIISDDTSGKSDSDSWQDKLALQELQKIRWLGGKKHHKMLEIEDDNVPISTATAIINKKNGKSTPSNGKAIPINGKSTPSDGKTTPNTADGSSQKREPIVRNLNKKSVTRQRSNEGGVSFNQFRSSNTIIPIPVGGSGAGADGGTPKGTPHSGSHSAHQLSSSVANSQPTIQQATPTAGSSQHTPTAEGPRPTTGGSAGPTPTGSGLARKRSWKVAPGTIAAGGTSTKTTRMGKTNKPIEDIIKEMDKQIDIVDDEDSWADLQEFERDLITRLVVSFGTDSEHRAIYHCLQMALTQSDMYTRLIEQPYDLNHFNVHRQTMKSRISHYRDLVDIMRNNPINFQYEK